MTEKDSRLLEGLVEDAVAKLRFMKGSDVKVSLETKDSSDFTYSHGECDAHIRIVIRR